MMYESGTAIRIRAARRAARSERRPLKLLLATSAAIALASCNRETPQSVCSAPETLSTVTNILLGNRAQQPIYRDIFDQIARIDLITFQGRDEQTDVINCQAQVQIPETGGAFDIWYSRQPTADGEFVYRLQYDRVREWNVLGMLLQSRVSASLQPQPVSPRASEPEATSPALAALAPHSESALPLSVRSTPSDVQATTRPDLAPPPPPPSAPLKEDRVEYVGPPVIAPGPPPPPSSERPSNRTDLLANPQWSRRPAARRFPSAARAQGVTNGSADLVCSALRSGRLTSCRVVEEVPAGAGFGEEALRAAQIAQLAPRSVDQLADDGEVMFSVGFVDRD
ncbi:MAG: energy transducer TonB [Caulobacteraceae bacterium]|nr:energy transducer TonB [Caulobacteraceae bacterium]